MAPEDTSRSCGLYRTTRALPGHEDTVGAERLVFFHNHSDSGLPIVLVAASNTNNKWRFGATAHPVRDPDFVAALERLKPEGLYRVREHFHPDHSRVVAAGALAQLGYNQRGEPILFFPQPVEGENAIAFPSRGMKIPPAVYALLDRLDLRGPREPDRLH